jgi:competence protein ComEA
MINSPVIQHNARNALAVWEILSFKRRSAVGALCLMWVLGVAILAGGSPVFAQQKDAQQSAAQQNPAQVNVAQEKATPAPPATSAAQVNINTADAQTLAAGLKGVGEARAVEIVRYRETYGPFASAEELVEVKGIGKSTVDMNRDVITLE